jgi:hypothetical protein
MYNRKTTPMNFKLNKREEAANGLDFLTYMNVRKTRRRNDKVNRRYYTEDGMDSLMVKRIMEELYNEVTVA